MDSARFWGKLNSLAYAVCHRIAERSYFFYSPTNAWCSPCTGMYPGGIGGFDLLFHPGQKGLSFQPENSFPAIRICHPFSRLTGSIRAAFLPWLPGVISSSNALRWVTGSGMGIVMAAMLVPVFTMSVWKDSIPRKLSTNGFNFSYWWGDRFSGFVGIISAILRLFPLAFLSTLTVVVILTLAYIRSYGSCSGNAMLPSPPFEMLCPGSWEDLLVHFPNLHPGRYQICNHRDLGGFHVIIFLGGRLC